MAQQFGQDPPLEALHPMSTSHSTSASSPALPNPSNALRKYITRNSVYYIRANVCLEVRERHSATAQPQHGATKQRIVACVRWRREGGHDVLIGTAPQVGDSLLLGDTPAPLVLTSAVRHIEDTLDTNSG